MIIYGYCNRVSSSGNKGVNVCLIGDWSEFDKNGKFPVFGCKSEMVYVSGIHLTEDDIGKECVLLYGKYDGKVYVRELSVIQ